MDTLHTLHDFTLRYLSTSDAYLLMTGALPLEQVRLRAPIPQPRLMFGLVQNSPSFWRSNPSKRITNFFPQGHQRPIGSVVGHGEIFLHRTGFNVELGVVIGKGGKYIPVEEAMEHVAGYTVVIDGQINDYYPLFSDSWEKGQDIEQELDWFVAATCSWAGKMSDAHCVMGPWLTTREEVGNPYDLLVYTSQDGVVRDRSHTAGTSQGIERTIHWFSSFMTLQPGDVLHMGTVGTDGIPFPEGVRADRNSCIGSQIERVGCVSARVLDPRLHDWRIGDEKRPNAPFSPQDEAIAASVVPAVTDFLREGREAIRSLEAFDLRDTRHFFPCYGNYRDAPREEGLQITRVPRFLGCPNSALARTGETIRITRRTKSLYAGVELAFVISRLACKVRREDAANYILGYAPLLTLADTSFAEEVVEPATGQERGLPSVYAHWADGYNLLGQLSIAEDPHHLGMSITVEGVGEAAGSTDEYVSDAAHVLETISRHITLFPGDVISLGRCCRRVYVPADRVCSGLMIRGQIDGLGAGIATLEKE